MAPEELRLQKGEGGLSLKETHLMHIPPLSSVAPEELLNTALKVKEAP